MIVVVTGGRNYQDRDAVFRALEEAAPALLFHGACCEKGKSQNLTGADRWADEWAKMKQIPHFVFPAEWDRHGNSAGPRRNRQMLAGAMALVNNPGFTASIVKLLAFPGGRGTANCKKTAESLGIEVKDCS